MTRSAEWKRRVFLASVFPEENDAFPSLCLSSFRPKESDRPFRSIRRCSTLSANEREKRGKREKEKRDGVLVGLENGGNRGDAASKTHLPPSRNEFVGCHSTGHTRLILSPPLHTFLSSSWLVWTKPGPLHGVATALAEFFTTDFSWRTRRKGKKRKDNNNKAL